MTLNNVHHLLSLAFPSGVRFIVAAILLLTLAMILIARSEARRRHFDSRAYFRGLISRATRFFLIGAGLSVALNQLIDYLQYALMNYVTAPQRTSLLVGGIALAWGMIAYAFKLRQQGWYGVAEILVGILVAQQSLSMDKVYQPPNLPIIIQFLLAVYVIVRGLSNAVDGFLGKVSSMPELVDAIMRKTDPQASVSASQVLKRPNNFNPRLHLVKIGGVEVRLAGVEELFQLLLAHRRAEFNCVLFNHDIVP